MSDNNSVQLADGTVVNIKKPDPLPDSDEEQPDNRVHLEKVNNVWGSTAGAGSDFFHLYRKQRAAEMERLEKMEVDWKEEQEDAKFREKRLLLIQANQLRAEKRASKRKKKKEAKQRYKHNKVAENEQGNVIKQDTSSVPNANATSSVNPPPTTVTRVSDWRERDPGAAEEVTMSLGGHVTVRGSSSQ